MIRNRHRLTNNNKNILTKSYNPCKSCNNKI